MVNKDPIAAWEGAYRGYGKATETEIASASRAVAVAWRNLAAISELGHNRDGDHSTSSERLSATAPARSPITPKLLFVERGRHRELNTPPTTIQRLSAAESRPSSR